MCETVFFRRSNLLLREEIATGKEQVRPRNDNGVIARRALFPTRQSHGTRRLPLRYASGTRASLSLAMT
jgi:hypothetical protein